HHLGSGPGRCCRHRPGQGPGGAARRRGGRADPSPGSPRPVPALPVRGGPARDRRAPATPLRLRPHPPPRTERPRRSDRLIGPWSLVGASAPCAVSLVLSWVHGPGSLVVVESLVLSEPRTKDQGPRTKDQGPQR